MMMGTDTDENNINAIKTLISHGINFFDSAEIYDLGKCETALGKAIKELQIPREKIVVTTKIFRNGGDPNDSFLSRKHIIEGLNQSLKRLQMDYVDVIYCHRPDKNTPIEETCRAMNYVIEKGMAFYWGTSEWDADQIMLAYKICEKLNLMRPIVEQTQYNLLHRDRIEREYANLFKNFKIGITVWSPLFSGALTGKYLKDVPEDSRYKKHNELNGYGLDYYFKNKKEIDEKLEKLKAIAEKKLNCTLAQMSIAWIIANPDISTVILGSTKISYVEENISTDDIYKRITKDIIKEIEGIFENPH
jgi:voltage-dependent potassium channel beta subunit